MNDASLDIGDKNNNIDYSLTNSYNDKIDFVAQSSTPGISMLAIMFTIWYGFNAAYNVYNAKVKTSYPFPLAIAASQLAVGLLYAFPMYIMKLRTIPSLNFDDFIKVLPIVLLNVAGHTSMVVAMFEKGGGSFTHVIKASEPVVSVILGIILQGKIPKPLTALTLIPITYGVAYASTLGNLNPESMKKELTTKAAKLAMLSNVAFSLRSIARSALPGDFKAKTNLDPINEFCFTTLTSLLLLIPYALYKEGSLVLKNAFYGLESQSSFIYNIFMCGMSFYLYNEMQNKVLGSLGPVPTAVGNTLKRVVIFVALYLFTIGESFPMPKIIGCTIAIAGCLAFAICDSKKI